MKTKDLSKTIFEEAHRYNSWAIGMNYLSYFLFFLFKYFFNSNFVKIDSKRTCPMCFLCAWL